MSTLFTIGFTQKSAEEFFTLLKKNKVTVVADIRLNNKGQLAGFTKARDLKYFLSIFGIEYQHWKDFAPTQEIRKLFHSNWDFAKYSELYTKLLQERDSISRLHPGYFFTQTVCLLCSEATPEKCHRRVAAEKIATHIPGLAIRHL